MESRVKLFLIYLLIFGVGMVFLCFWILIPNKEFDYQENKENIDNPGRGLYMQISTKEPERIIQTKEYGLNLAMVTMDLKENITGPINDEQLGELRSVLQQARELGIMVIFRGAYKWNENVEEPSLETMAGHIAQLSEVLNEYEDSILVVQTGMIGLWGEWHTSLYLDTEEKLSQEALQVVDGWLNNLDSGLCVDLRRPYFIQVADEIGLDTSRIGMHNDGLLGSDTDLGTYLDRAAELDWCADNLTGRINGGEMPYVSDYTEISNTAEEFQKLSLTYLNAFYNEDVLKSWETQTYQGENARIYIEKHLGYRYYIKSIKIPKYLSPWKKSIPIQITINNSGFADVKASFQPYLVINQNSDVTYITLEEYKTDKNSIIYKANIPIPEVAENGNINSEFTIGICYTDRNPKEDISYAHYIELANNDMIFDGHTNYYISCKYANLVGHTEWTQLQKQ